MCMYVCMYVCMYMYGYNRRLAINFIYFNFSNVFLIVVLTFCCVVFALQHYPGIMAYSFLESAGRIAVDIARYCQILLDCWILYNSRAILHSQ